MIKTFTLIIMLLLVSYLSVMVLHKPVPKQMKDNTVADMIFEEVTIQDFNPSGELNQVISATRAYHDPGKKMDFYQQPSIQYFKADEAPWHLTSDKGHSNEARDTLFFEQHVIIKQSGSQTKPSTLIKTNSLQYNVKAKTAETRDKITLTQGDTRVKSIGAFINLETHLLKLLSEPEGFYG